MEEWGEAREDGGVGRLGRMEVKGKEQCAWYSLFYLLPQAPADQ